MEKFWKRVIDAKVNPLYWPIILLLWIASLFYRLGLFLHGVFNSTPVRVGVPVISVGNLTVGGTGKTPVTIELARRLTDMGKRVGIVSLGYGRRDTEEYFGSGKEIVKRSAEEIGDEVLMMAGVIPEAVFGVGRSKSDSALRLVEKFRPDVIIVDDAFQHRRLHRDLDILLIDSRIDLRRESIFPLGKLREPINAISRADLLGITHRADPEENIEFVNWMVERSEGKPLIAIEFQNSKLISIEGAVALDSLIEKSAYVFAGIGDGEAFVRSMRKHLENIAGFRIFSDHCRYLSADLGKIRSDIETINPYYLVTTQKDFVKLKGFDFDRPLYYVNLQLDFDDGEKTLKEALERLFK